MARTRRRGFDVVGSIAVLGISAPAAGAMNWCLHEPEPVTSTVQPFALDTGEVVVATGVPAGVIDLRAELSSNADVDVRVVTQGGTKLVHRIGGVLSGPDPGEATSLGMTFRWTGYDGIDGVVGHELVELDTATEVLSIVVAANAPGTGNVIVQWAQPCENPQTVQVAVNHQESVSIGTLPAGTIDPFVESDSAFDIDLQLLDPTASEEIIRWPDGLLNGATPETIVYDGMEISYSGYNGIGGQLGDERFDILGTTNNPLDIRVFGYQAGVASVTFGGTPVPSPRYELDWCWNEGPCPAPGRLAAIALQAESFRLGTIPAGTVQPWIETDSDDDIDLQLVDVATGTPIVRWPDGLLNGPGAESTVYEGMGIAYSGYNGTFGDPGDERIAITNTTTRPLDVFVFGYQNASANVTYAPEPGALASLVAAVATLWVLARRRRPA